MKDHVAETVAATVKSVPAAAAVGATIFGFTLTDAAAFAGLVFILLQSAHLIWRWRREAKQK